MTWMAVLLKQGKSDEYRLIFLFFSSINFMVVLFYPFRNLGHLFSAVL